MRQKTRPVKDVGRPVAVGLGAGVVAGGGVGAGLGEGVGVIVVLGLMLEAVGVGDALAVDVGVGDAGVTWPPPHPDVQTTHIMAAAHTPTWRHVDTREASRLM
jgi:hypothetical protein